ncbi:MAG: helix-turn-helix transcriptional regulator [Planctomycetaceae bacterium]|nr:helix-turn-helix transcriptional regulator [Planctomycetaceae bacterium]
MAIDTNERVASRVRAVAAERRVTQSELATALSISKMSMSRRFNGITPFTIADLTNAAQFLDVPLTELLSRSTPSTPSSGVPSPQGPGEGVTSVSGGR